jgi:hypothetical protein
MSEMRGRWFGLMPILANWWDHFLAYFHLSQMCVCNLSAGRGEYDDYHDYQDSEIGAPLHEYLHTCKHCGKEFRI